MRACSGAWVRHTGFYMVPRASLATTALNTHLLCHRSNPFIFFFTLCPHSISPITCLSPHPLHSVHLDHICLSFTAQACIIWTESPLQSWVLLNSHGFLHLRPNSATVLAPFAVSSCEELNKHRFSSQQPGWFGILSVSVASPEYTDLFCGFLLGRTVITRTLGDKTDLGKIAASRSLLSVTFQRSSVSPPIFFPFFLNFMGLFQ